MSLTLLELNHLARQCLEPFAFVISRAFAVAALRQEAPALSASVMVLPAEALSGLYDQELWTKFGAFDTEACFFWGKAWEKVVHKLISLHGVKSQICTPWLVCVLFDDGVTSLGGHAFNINNKFIVSVNIIVIKSGDVFR